LICIVSPYEADAQLAYLSRIGFIDAIITEDSDLVCFGAKKILYKLNGKGLLKEIQLKDWQKCSEFDFKDWDFDQFLSLCIISGCDYLPSIKNIGFKKAYKGLKDTRNVENLLKKWRMDSKMDIPQEYEEKFYKAFLTFKFQRVFCPRQRKMTHVNELNLDKFEEAIKESMNIGSLGKILQNPEILTPILIKKLKGFLEIDKELEFLGKNMTESLICGIGDGVINPITLKPYEEGSILKINLELNRLNNPIMNCFRKASQPKKTITAKNEIFKYEKFHIKEEKCNIEEEEKFPFQEEKSTIIEEKCSIIEEKYNFKQRNFPSKEEKCNIFKEEKCNIFKEEKCNIFKEEKMKISDEIIEEKEIETLNTKGLFDEFSKKPNTQKGSFELRKGLESFTQNSFLENLRKRALENASRIRPEGRFYEKNSESLNKISNETQKDFFAEKEKVFQKKPFQKEILSYFIKKNTKELLKDTEDSDFSLKSKRKSPFVQEKTPNKLKLKTPEVINKQKLKQIMKKNPLKRTSKQENQFCDPVEKIMEIQENKVKITVWKTVNDVKIYPLKIEGIINEFKEKTTENYERKEDALKSKQFFTICEELFKPLFP